MSFDTSLRNTLCLNNVATVRKEDRKKKKYANWLNLFKIPMSCFSYFKIKTILDNDKKGVCVFLDGLFKK